MFSCGFDMINLHVFFVTLYISDIGTAGVWRISALNEAGGWKDRTTVEDMDLAVRASLKGWKFLYLANLQVPFNLQAMIYSENCQKIFLHKTRVTTR